jgi:hypothetical protein
MAARRPLVLQCERRPGALLGPNMRMREVDAILGKFPGPVTLYVSWRKKLLGLALSLGFAGFCAYILVTGFVSGWYDTMMAWISVAFFGALAVRALILLLVPSGASLTLDADGFEVCGVFLYRRTAWRDVRGVRVEKSGDDTHLTVMYDVLSAGAPKVAKALPANYGLSRDDLAWLMGEWRQRALTPIVEEARTRA